MTERPDTYFTRAQEDDSPGGRFAARKPKAVTGASVLPLAAPNWARDPSGDEPPLGYCIDEVPSAEMYGFPHEARLEAEQAAQANASNPGVGEVAVTPKPTQVSLRRI